jgi:hypothetical protein
MAISSWAGGKIVIMSSGMGARHPMLNKDRYAARFQDVVGALCEDLEFVQLGATSDPPIGTPWTSAVQRASGSQPVQCAAFCWHCRIPDAPR